jgi:hypothetical protein
MAIQSTNNQGASLYTRQEDVLAMKAALESSAYYHGVEYGRYGITKANWFKNEPLPASGQLTKAIITDVLSFLYQGGNPVFSVPNSPSANAALAKIIVQNKLDAKWQAISTDLAIHGTMAVKFSYDPKRVRNRVQIEFLPAPERVRFYYDPANVDNVLGCRIQTPKRDMTNGKLYLEREDWTDNEWITYEPIEIGDATCGSLLEAPGYTDYFGDDKQWTEKPNEFNGVNPFGICPCVPLKNRAVHGMLYGLPECAGSYRIQDQIAGTSWFESRYNQLSSKPIIVALDADLINNGDPAKMGEFFSAISSQEDVQGMIKMLEPLGSNRQSVSDYKKYLEAKLYAVCSVSDPNLENLVNSGMMTSLALFQTWRRSIANAKSKQNQLGNMGLVPFFQAMLEGLANYQCLPELADFDVESDLVSVTWPQFFERTDQDKLSAYNRVISRFKNGLMAKEDAIRELEKIDGNHPEIVEKHVANALKEAVGLDADAGGDVIGNNIGEIADAAGGTGY